MLLFSATYDQDVMKFAQVIVPNPVLIRLRREEESLDNIKQYYIACNSQNDKFQALANIYGAISIGQSMIFCAVSCFIVIFSLCHLRKDSHGCRVLASRMSGCLFGTLVHKKYLFLGEKTPYVLVGFF